MSRNKYLDEFMASFPHEGLTFDDVSLVTQYADFLPPEADVTSPLSVAPLSSIPCTIFPIRLPADPRLF